MRFVLIVAGAFLFANGSTATTLADPQSRSGVWEGVITDSSREDANARLFLMIETEGKAADGTFRITSLSGQIRRVSLGRPQPLNHGYCNLDDLKLTQNELSGTCFPGWRPTVEPARPVALDFEVTYQSDGAILVGKLSRGTEIFPIRLHRLHQDLSSADGNWVAAAGDRWGASTGTAAVLHIATGIDGSQIATADYLDAIHATWGLEFIVAGQPDPQSVFLIEGHGKGSQFHGKVSADKTKMTGQAAGGQFLPSTLTRITEAGRPIH